jgi:octanoyl-[GcvH]:protein N-octanoyltransferase
MRLVRDGFPEDPAMDVATGRALLEGAARGRLGATLRVYRPGPTVAFGRLDRLSPGFGDAVAAARAHGFEPVLRQPGGHAAAYDEGSVCFDQVLPDAAAIPALQDRFRESSDVIAGALRALGVDARVGEVPGEYCPGAWTVNAGGRVKLAGTAQRVVRGGSLLGAVVVIRNGARVRAVLEDVYAHLAMPFDPSTAGAAEDGVGGLEPEEFERALVAAYAERAALEPGALDAATVRRAHELAEEHRLTRRPGRPA